MFGRNALDKVGALSAGFLDDAVGFYCRCPRCHKGPVNRQQMMVEVRDAVTGGKNNYVIADDMA
ncbi:MAG: hypothetical protein M3Q27_06075 [Actinomycetota bacterium]|nr:hypothetical protein [Actinomycetota bacterium]